MTTEKIFSLEIKKLENIDISTIYEILKTKDRIYKKFHIQQTVIESIKLIS